MKIFNLTLHPATQEMIEWGIKQGNSSDSLYGDNDTFHSKDDEIIFSEPMGKEIDTSFDGFTVREMADELISEVISQDGNNILVGGLTDMAYHLIGYALKRNITVYVTVTKRERDKNDRFIFKFSGLREVWKNVDVFYE